MGGAAIVRAVLGACLDQVLANATELAAGHRSAESIHQLRVGIRRARTAWRALAVLAPAAGPTGKRRWPTRSVPSATTATATPWSPRCRRGSPSRDRPSRRWRPRRSSRRIRSRWSAPRRSRSPCSTRWPWRFPASMRSAAPGRSDARDLIGARLDRLHKRLKRAASDFEASAPAEQHRARKRLKRLRYLGELVGTLYRPGRVERYLRRLSPAQDASARTSISWSASRWRGPRPRPAMRRPGSTSAG